MALEHEQAATEILKAVGGKDNIVSAAHCATRLRLVIADDSKVDMDAVEDAKLAKGNFQANGQLQVIYGTGTVNKVYDEFVKQAGISAGSTDDAKAAAPKGNPLQRAIKALGDVFVPIIPAIVASGLLMGLTEGLNNAMGGALELNSWYLLIHTFANASFVFLQILIGFSAARVFGGNEYLGGVIGMIMNHTALINAWNIPGAVTAFGDAAYQTVGTQAAADWLTSVTGTAVNAAGATVSAIIEAGGIPQIQLFGFYNVVLQGYQGHVIPVVIAVFLMCQIEKWFHNHVPDMFDLFVTPLCTVLITGILTLTVIGPVFSAFEELVLQFFQFLIAIPYGLGGALTGAIYPFTVVLGVHHMFNALEASMCALVPPYDNFNPILSCCNVAQGAACLAVFMKTASEKKKGLALPSGISSLLGITEPAVYGVNLPAVRPFIGAICGAAVGGALVSILGVYSTAYGITGLFGFLITATPVQYAISILVAFAVAFGVTFVLYSDDDAARRAEQKRTAAKADAEAKTEAAELPQVTDAPSAQADDAQAAAAGVAPAGIAISQAAADALAAGERVLVSPMAGKCIPMSEVGDPMFAAEVMGGGVGILPTDGKIYSPVTGMVMMLFDTKHAIGLCTDDGSVEVLIHCGIDTVSLGGAPFTAHVKQGDHVEAGQLLMEADLAAIEAAGLKTDTPVIVTNTDAFETVEGVNTGTTVAPGDLVVAIR